MPRKLPKKFTYKHRRKSNKWGEHDEYGFFPEHDYPVRCFECNRLCDPSFLYSESKCPNCNREFTKQEARDISVEAQIINQNYNGWDKKILDRFEDTSGADRPSHVDKELDPVTGHKQDSKMDVAREMTGWANEAGRDLMKVARAEKELKRRAKVKELVQRQSNLDSIIHENPFK